MSEIDPVVGALGLDEDEDVAVVVARLAVISYITPEGEQAYYVSAGGEAPMTTYLGLTVVAQQHILTWGQDG